jgi:hypothetical protein
MITVNYAECRKQTYYAECPYAECRYAECRGANIAPCWQGLALTNVLVYVAYSSMTEKKVYNIDRQSTKFYSSYKVGDILKLLTNNLR